MKKLLMVTTIPMILETWLKGQPKFLSQHFEVEVVTSSSATNSAIAAEEGVPVVGIDMSRQITPLKDLLSLIRLIRYIRRFKPDIVYSTTPKAGLLTMVASFFCAVPVRVHCIVGLPLIEASGLRRELLVLMERITYFFATHLYCNSFGLKTYIEQHLSSKTVKVIANGSVNGVDTTLFNDNYSAEQKMQLRQKLSIDDDATVLTFIGRIVRDKGVNELIEAFEQLSQRYPSLILLLIGPSEEHLDPVDAQTAKCISEHKKIRRIDYLEDVRPYLAISDLFVLPSYREGLPNVLIEAGCFDLPLIATDINGCNEVVIDGENGLLIEKKSVKSLTDAVSTLLDDDALYERLKKSVRQSIISRYEQGAFLEALRTELFAIYEEAHRGKTAREHVS